MLKFGKQGCKIHGEVIVLLLLPNIILILSMAEREGFEPSIQV